MLEVMENTLKNGLAKDVLFVFIGQCVMVAGLVKQIWQCGYLSQGTVRPWGWPFSHECWARVVCSSPLAVPCVCHGERAQQSSCSAAHLLCSQRRALNYPKETNAWCRLKIPDIRTCQKFCVSCGGGFRNVLRGYQNLLLSQICFWMMCQHLFKVNIERLVGIIRKNFHK